MERKKVELQVKGGGRTEMSRYMGSSPSLGAALAMPLALVSTTEGRRARRLEATIDILGLKQKSNNY